MDVRKAAELTLERASLINPDRVTHNHPWYGKIHAFDMLEAIRDGKVEGEKAHRWLGWAQCIMCVGDAATLDQLKEINHKA